MTWLSDSTPLIAGAWLSSVYDGQGVLGGNVPSSGADGAAPLYYCLTLPADAGKEVRSYLTRWPVGGTFSIGEDSAFDYTGPNDYFEFLLYVDGVASTTDIGYGAGISRIALATGAEFVGSVVADDAAPSGSFGTAAASFSGAVQADDGSPTGAFTGGVPSTFSGTVNADDSVPSGAFAPGNASAFSGAVAADDAAVSASFGSVTPAVFAGDVHADDAAPAGAFSGGVPSSFAAAITAASAAPLGAFSGGGATPDTQADVFTAPHENRIFVPGGILSSGFYVLEPSGRTQVDKLASSSKVFGLDISRRLQRGDSLASASCTPLTAGLQTLSEFSFAGSQMLVRVGPGGASSGVLGITFAWATSLGDSDAFTLYLNLQPDPTA